MKIVTKQQFLQMKNVVYAEYKPSCIDQVCIMHGALTHNDFNYSVLFGDIDAEGAEESFDIYYRMEQGESFPMEVEITRRDGMYDEEQLYMVFEKEDIVKVTATLMRLLETYPHEH